MVGLGNLLRETFRSLRAHALRFGLTSLGILWGVAMLTYMNATAAGNDRFFVAQFEKIGERIVFVFPGVVTDRSRGAQGLRRVKLEMEDVERMATLQSVERAAPNLGLGPRLIRARGRAKLIHLSGVSEHTAVIRNYEVGAGRLLARHDVEGARKVVFLGAKAAERLFGARPAVGQIVQIEAIPFEVVGVAQGKGQQMVNIGTSDDNLALIPITTAQRWFSRNDDVAQVVYAPRTRPESYESVPAVRGLTGLHHRFDEQDENALNMFNLQEGVEMLHTLLGGQRIFLRATSFVTLLVGAMGVMNIMLVVVTERTKEIGLRKAVGASQRAIFLQFLSESVAVTLLAGFVGTALAVAGALLVAHGMQTSGAEGPAPVVVLSSVVAIFVTLVGTGVAAGLLPAVRASRIEPAISLRAL